MNKSIVWAALLMMLLLIFASCETNINQPIAAKSNVPSAPSDSAIATSDDALIAEFTRLIDEAVPVINWWLGMGDSLDQYGLKVECDAEPYLDEYYPIDGFTSIEQLKEQTEMTLTKPLAESFLYIVNADPDAARFIEHEGKLYIQRDAGGFGLPYGDMENPIVKSKSQTDAVITVTVYEYGLKKDVNFDFFLKKEDDRWK
ncbi:MAG: hypothetical protein ACERKO_13530, partial [Acetanaerobacterium sp.]